MSNTPLTNGTSRINGNISSTPPNDGEELVKFDTNKPCIFCAQPLAAIGHNPIIHWSACSTQRREDIRSTNVIHDGPLPIDPFAALKARYTAQTVNEAGKKFFCMLKGLECLGNDDFRPFLEYIGTYVFTSQLEKDICDVMVRELPSDPGNIHAIIALEDWLGYSDPEGRMNTSDPDSAAVIPTWKRWEVQLLDDLAKVSDMGVFAAYGDFIDAYRRREETLPPGRELYGFAVWMYNLVTAGGKPL